MNNACVFKNLLYICENHRRRACNDLIDSTCILLLKYSDIGSNKNYLYFIFIFKFHNKSFHLFPLLIKPLSDNLI